MGSGDYVASRLLDITKGVDTVDIKLTDSDLGIDDDAYNEVFAKTQQYIVDNKLPELTGALSSNNFSVLRQLVIDYIKKNFVFQGMEPAKFDHLIQKCMDDMTGYGFLNTYFANRENIEEININGWDTILVAYRNGEKKIIDEKFQSAQHARDVILRILQQNKKHLDENKVYEISYIGKAVRIATMITPVADPEIGVVASIRFIHSAVFSLDELTRTGMLNEEAAYALMQFINHGVSICFCGSTGSGKTTVLNALLETVPPMTRLITLEGGTREFDLIRKDEHGKTVNDRVHLQTRPHENKNLNVDLQVLLDIILKFDPEIVAVGEMVSEEAFIASETARTGHTVVTTIHTNNAYDAYYKMFTLGIRKYDLNEKIMLKFMVDAFPVVVYTKRYVDGVRRIQTILEGEFVNGKIVYTELFHFRVTDNIRDKNGKVKVIGEFEKVNTPTDKLKQLLLDNGLAKEIVDAL